MKRIPKRDTKAIRKQRSTRILRCVCTVLLVIAAIVMILVGLMFLDVAMLGSYLCFAFAGIAIVLAVVSIYRRVKYRHW